MPVPWLGDLDFERVEKVFEFCDQFGDRRVTRYIMWFILLCCISHRFPDHFILSTEACNDPLTSKPPIVSLGDWSRGNKYSHSIIEVHYAFHIKFVLSRRYLDTAFSGSHLKKDWPRAWGCATHCEGNQIPDFILLLSPRRMPAQSESCESSWSASSRPYIKRD